MKTTMINKVEALKNERADWDTRNAEQKAKYEAQYEVYNNSVRAICDKVKDQIIATLGNVTIHLEVKVDQGMRFINPGVEVKVSSEQHNVHGENKALSWEWGVSLDTDGNPSRSSSSWSGLQATTTAQIESLKETARVLEALNNMDWARLLNVTLPDYAKIVTERSSIGERPRFEADIRAAEIAELLGTNTLVKGSPLSGKGRGTAWYLIVSESPKQFKVVELSGYGIQEQCLAERGQTLAQAVEQAKNWQTGVSKEKFISDIIGKTVETMSFN